MKERINAFFSKHFGAEMFPENGTNAQIEESHVEGLEAMGTELETLRASTETLKGENQAHAERIAELEATVEAAATAETVISAALEANNVEVPEGADLAAIVAEKINAWGKTVPAATAAVSTSADDLGDNDEDPTLTDIDKRAREKWARKNKK